LKARESMRGRGNEEPVMDQAIQYLEQAVDIDPGFADAWSYLAWLLSSKVHFDFGDPEENLRSAEAALARAKNLAQQRNETLLAEAYVFYHGKKDYQRAIEILAKAGAQEPGRPEVLAAEAYVLRRLYRLMESLEKIQEAIRLDP